jgi:hypothetical protein
MEYIWSVPLKLLKSINSKVSIADSNFGRNWTCFPLKEYSSDLIYKELVADRPSMIARLGSTELNCMVNYLGVKYPGKYKSFMGYIGGQTPAWWWNKSIVQQMQEWSGFFPTDIANVDRFCELAINDLSKVDILGSWLKEERFFKKELSAAKRVMLEDLEPFFTKNPWTRALEGKRVLVVHPFNTAIEKQYLKRKNLFEDNLLPDFDLLTIKAVQSLASEPTVYPTWFHALESMKQQISSVEFDICILGCGAYGFPLAAFVKDIGKKAIHLGGVTQLLFGIKGKRWEDYVVYPYQNLYNEHWIRPGEDGRPKNSEIVEGGCYW